MTDISRKTVDRISASNEKYGLNKTARTLRALRDALDKAEAEKRELALQVIASEGQACDAYAAQTTEWNSAIEAAAMLLENAAPVSIEAIKNSTASAIMANLNNVLKSTNARDNAAAIRDLKRCPHPNKQASTCGFESCPDCGARLED